MKKIIATFIAGLVLIAGTVLNAQPREGHGIVAGQKIRDYMENTIMPELLKQKKLWIDALTKEEVVELLKIQDEQKAIRSNMKGMVAPENRESVRKAHFLAFKPRLDKIVDAHPALKENVPWVILIVIVDVLPDCIWHDPDIL